jgi:cellobiose phosphorylase
MNNNAAQENNTLLFENAFGGFDVLNHEYVIRHGGTTVTPRPWGNVIANSNFGTIVTESSFGSSWFDNSKDKRITTWSNDAIIDSPSEVIYMKDRATGKYWSVTRKPCVFGYHNEDVTYTTRHGNGYSIFSSTVEGVEQTATVVVDRDDPIKVIYLKIKNTAAVKKDLSLFYYLDIVMGNYKNQFDSFVTITYEPDRGGARIERSDKSEFGKFVFVGISEPVTNHTFNKNAFLGYTGTLGNPQGITKGIGNASTEPRDNCCVLECEVTLEAGEEREISFYLGAAESGERHLQLVQKIKTTSSDTIIGSVKEYWQKLSNALIVTTPDPMMDLIFNQWALYQTLACRIWGRSSFYQSSGAYGFRDQLQDSMSLVYVNSALCKEHILRAAARQFEEGDVQHWWFGDSSLGVRNKVSDSALWLAYITDFYVEKTGDTSIYDEVIPYLKGKPLTDELAAYVEIPQVSEIQESLWQHCVKAIEKTCEFGIHGIPLIKEGDWNDGMNLVGEEGKGESIWLGWFLGTNLKKYAERARERGQHDIAEKFSNTYENLRNSMHGFAWDENWYLRAYTDDGHRLGSANEVECMIDSISQSWAVLSDMDEPARQVQAIHSALNYLVDHENELAMLLYPAFDKGPINPGYIKDYVPGIRENGGQYSHAAFWLVMALAKQGNNDMAHQILMYTNPIYRSRDAEKLERYELEPYVIGGDIYSSKQHMTKGGWSWYSASSGLYYRTVIESIVGLKKTAHALVFEPCVPGSWRSMNVRYTYGSSVYDIKYSMGEGHRNNVTKVSVDWHESAGNRIDLIDDGKEHKVLVYVS